MKSGRNSAAMDVKAFSREATLCAARRFRAARRVEAKRGFPAPGGARGWSGLTGRTPLPTPLLAAFAALLAVTAICGCGGSAQSRSQEELVVEGALLTALSGERAGFTRLVAPSFLAQARSMMPDSGDETLGAVLIAGFLEDVPFAGIVAAEYDVESGGDEAAVYVWGTFVDGGGAEVRISEGDALRFPLVREGGRWYIDLLDL